MKKFFKIFFLNFIGTTIYGAIIFLIMHILSLFNVPVLDHEWVWVVVVFLCFSFFIDFSKDFIKVKIKKINKILKNSPDDPATKNVEDLKKYGNPDLFQLICKASSEEEGWMKSTKAMQITGVGCVIQVTTQQGDNVAEALTFVPNTYIDIDEDGNKYINYITLR